MDEGKILAAKVKIEIIFRDLSVDEKLELIYLLRRDIVREMGGNV